MPSLIEFSDNMGKLALRLDKGIVETVQRVAIGVLTEVVKETPVDVGTARSNWQVGIIAAPTNTIAAHSPILPRLRSARATLAAGRFNETANTAATILAGTIKIKQFQGDGRIFISNSVTELGYGYINLLNTGRHSLQQTKVNFVQIAARKAVTGIRGTKILP